VNSSAELKWRLWLVYGNASQRKERNCTRAHANARRDHESGPETQQDKEIHMLTIISKRFPYKCKTVLFEGILSVSSGFESDAPVKSPMERNGRRASKLTISASQIEYHVDLIRWLGGHPK
jgi:hypothetical protein